MKFFISWCVYVCMYVCIYMCMYMYVYIYIYIYKVPRIFRLQTCKELLKSPCVLSHTQVTCVTYNTCAQGCLNHFPLQHLLLLQVNRGFGINTGRRGGEGEKGTRNQNTYKCMKCCVVCLHTRETVTTTDTLPHSTGILYGLFPIPKDRNQHPYKTSDETAVCIISIFMFLDTIWKVKKSWTEWLTLYRVVVPDAQSCTLALLLTS
jgi:hypothetical protein